MRSKTSFFNKTLFRKAFSRTVPFMIVYVVIWTMFTTIPVINLVPEPERIKDLQEYLANLSRILPVIFSFGWAVIISMCTFGFFNRKGSTLALFSMPVGRAGLFISVYMAGLCAFLCSDLFVCLATGILVALKGLAITGTVVTLFFSMLLTNIIFYGIASFSAVLTGSTIAIPFIYAALNYLPLFLEASLRSIMSFLRYGFGNNQEYLLDRITPTVDLLTRPSFLSVFDYSTDNPAITVKHYVWAGVSVLFAVLACLIFLRRKAEVASELAAVRIMRPILRILASVFCAILLGRWYILFVMIFGGIGEAVRTTGTSGTTWILFAFMALGLAIGWFACEMLLRKRLKVFTKKTLAGFAVLLAVLALFIYWFHADPLGGMNAIPQADNVDYVEFYNGDCNVRFEDPSAIAKITDLERYILENKEDNLENATDTLELVYYTNSGRRIARLYEVHTYDPNYPAQNPVPLAHKIYEILSLPEAVHSILMPFGERLPEMMYYGIELEYYGNVDGDYTYNELTREQFEDIYYNGLAKDADEMNYTYSMASDAVGCIYISTDRRYVSINILPSMVNTIEVSEQYRD